MIEISIYKEVAEDIRRKIISGKYDPGQQLQSILSLAELYNVNKNTVQMALATLREEELVITVRGKGNFVIGSVEKIALVKECEKRRRYEEFLRAMGTLGYNEKSIQAEVEIHLRRHG
ncbi:GntR family transcriptional regulator [Terribacillus saccharophilus]|uniref:GntR family transcriptional regulator n=1 Tax=Terribacillus saccharophilus TaxID=361277 RepID=UPI0037FC52E9